MLCRYATVDFTTVPAVVFHIPEPIDTLGKRNERTNEWRRREKRECSSKRAVMSRRARNFGRSLLLFFLVTLAAKKRAHKYRAEATSDRLVKVTRAVHASHPREPVTTDSALISPGRAIHGKRSITRRFISVMLFPPSPSPFPSPPLPPFAVFRLGAFVITEWLSDFIGIDDIVTVTHRDGNPNRYVRSRDMWERRRQKHGKSLLFYWIKYQRNLYNK